MSRDYVHIDTWKALEALDQSEWHSWGGTISGEYSELVLDEWSHLSDVDCQIFYGPGEPYDYLTAPEMVEQKPGKDIEISVVDTENAWDIRLPRDAFELLEVNLGQPRHDWKGGKRFGPNFLRAQLEIIYDPQNTDIGVIGEAINANSPENSLDSYITPEPNYSDIKEKIQRIEDNEEAYDGIRNQRPLYGGKSINGATLGIYSPSDFSLEKFRDNLGILKKTGEEIVSEINNPV